MAAEMDKFIKLQIASDKIAHLAETADALDRELNAWAEPYTEGPKDVWRAFVRDIAAAEREACAKIVDDLCPNAHDVAAAIRARSNPSTQKISGKKIQCPFDDPTFAPGPEVPCPVCGDLGSDFSDINCVG
jgi:hypothetical protein